jgi:hypothetical protein
MMIVIGGNRSTNHGTTPSLILQITWNIRAPTRDMGISYTITLLLIYHSLLELNIAQNDTQHTIIYAITGGYVMLMSTDATTTKDV